MSWVHCIFLYMCIFWYLITFTKRHFRLDAVAFSMLCFNSFSWPDELCGTQTKWWLQHIFNPLWLINSKLVCCQLFLALLNDDCNKKKIKNKKNCTNTDLIMRIMSLFWCNSDSFNLFTSLCLAVFQFYGFLNRLINTFLYNLLYKYVNKYTFTVGIYLFFFFFLCVISVPTCTANGPLWRS